jgi:Zn finger protein HypA/HybF involved in hydrogenase expression
MTNFKVGMDKRICLKCGTNKTHVDKRGWVQWSRYKDGFMCSRCNSKFVRSPRDSPIFNPRRILFKGKRILLKAIPRKGQCEQCGKKIGDSFISYRNKLTRIKRTEIHHIQYHDDDPLKDTIELCPQCHGYITNERHHSVENAVYVFVFVDSNPEYFSCTAHNGVLK